ncbi:hypothetical protein V7150_09680 [Neobacillus drentensis]
MKLFRFGRDVRSEQHESGSETGMTVIIIESPRLHPEQLLKTL